MSRPDDQPNPDAPPQLARFAFLIGTWRCEARVKLPTGDWQRFDATWRGRYILDGHAIADEYRMTDASGTLIVLGMNFRVYDRARQTWNLKWLHALAGTWLDLGPSDLGGVTIDEQSVSYVFKEPMADHTFTRAIYTNISDTHFTWRGEKSDDGLTWNEFMIVEADRLFRTPAPSRS
jgi:hypothetical protein